MNSKAWKVSASVIITLRSPNVRDSLLKCESSKRTLDNDLNHKSLTRSNLHILSLRRGKSDKLLPGIHVFPGGHLDEADSSPAWIDLYHSFGYEEKSFSCLSTGGGIEHFPEYKSGEKGQIPGWMSLRLCAIRETFEESGILLCRSPIQVEQHLTISSFVMLNELTAWQRRVRADPKQLLALCYSAGCVPDLWGLHLWSNWLTPTQQRVRHNSVFFLVALPSLPPYSVDTLEMDELKHCRVTDLIDDAHSGKIRLANPQYYEALRLANFTDPDKLALFACNRATLGCKRTMPVQEKTTDGMLFILPGDSAYPKDIDYETPQKLFVREECMRQLRERVREQHGTLHRVEVPAGSLCQQVVTENYEPPYGHVLPFVSCLIRNGPKSHI